MLALTGALLPFHPAADTAAASVSPEISDVASAARHGDRPVSRVVEDGKTATRHGSSMTGAGAVRPSVVLQVDADVRDATSPTSTLDLVACDMDGRPYRAQHTGWQGSASSVPAALRATYSLPPASGTAPPGGTTVLTVHDPASSRTGDMTITAPTGTTILWANRVQVLPSGGVQSQAFQVSEDRKTASGLNAEWGGEGSTMNVALRVDDDAVLDSVLDDGVVQVLDDGVLVASGSLTVVVDGAIEILEHPGDVTVAMGARAELRAAAAGHGVSVQWQVSADRGATWVDVAGATETTLTVDDVVWEMDGWQYRAVFSNPVRSSTTRAATLTVTLPPHLVTHFLSYPADQHVSEGEIFSLVWRFHASGPGRRLVQLSDDEGETWTTHTVGSFAGPAAPGAHFVVPWRPVATAEHDGQLVRMVLVVDGEETASETARLTVDPVPPVVEVHPDSRRVIEGTRVELVTRHSGTTFPTTVRWQLSTDGGATWDDVEGETEATLTLSTATLDMDGWQLRAVHTNAAGSAVSDTAILTVHPRPPRATVTVSPAVRVVDRLP